MSLFNMFPMLLLRYIFPLHTGAILMVLLLNSSIFAAARMPRTFMIKHIMYIETGIMFMRKNFHSGVHTG